METLAAQTFSFGDFELDGAKRRLLKLGKPVPLNSKTFDLLLALVENHGSVLSREELLDKVWANQFVEENNLAVQVSALRKVFGEKKDEHRFIVTVPGKGYSFVAELNEPTDSEIVVESHSLSRIIVEEETTENGVFDNIEGNSANHPELTLPGRSNWRHRGLLVSFSIILIAATGLAYWLFSRTSSISAPIKSIAVMPFVNESGNADLEYLSDGLTESLIGSLSQLPDLSVKARTSVARYKGKDLDLQKIGSELSVETILTGRLVQRGDEVILYVEFVEPATEKVLWKVSYHRPVKEIAALETDISRDVAKRLKPRLSGEDNTRLEKYQTDNSEAYELYLRGSHYSSFQRMLAGKNSKGIEYLEQAIALDPNYAIAYVQLAWAHIRLGHALGDSQPHDTFPKAREALLKALSIDDNLAPAHSALAVYYLRYEWNWPAAEREFERSIELDPEDPGALLEYGGYFVSIGRFDDAVRVREMARKLLPASAAMVSGVGFSYFHARNYERALEYLREALELRPNFAPTRVSIARCYLGMRMYPEAIAELEKAVEDSQRHPIAVAYLADTYARTGRRNDANKLLGELRSRTKEEYIPSYLFALVHAGLGNKDKAFEYLEQSHSERQAYLTTLRVDPSYDDLRSDPRFDDLVKKVCIPE